MSVLQKYSKSSIYSKTSIIEKSKARRGCGMKDQITLTDVECMIECSGDLEASYSAVP